MDIHEDNLLDCSDLKRDKTKSVMLELDFGNRFPNTFVGEDGQKLSSDEVVSLLTSQDTLYLIDEAEVLTNEEKTRLVFETQFLAQRVIDELNDFITRKRARVAYGQTG